MNTGESTDLGATISNYMHAAGRIPQGGMAVETDYVVVARVRVLHDDGTHSTTYEHFHSPRVEPCSHEGMAARALRVARDRNS